MREIIKALNLLTGEFVDIYTDHKLFGKQHIQMQFEPETELGSGFRCKGQRIYIDHDDVTGYTITNEKIVVYSKLMRITIIK